MIPLSQQIERVAEVLAGHTARSTLSAPQLALSLLSHLARFQAQAVALEAGLPPAAAAALAGSRQSRTAIDRYLAEGDRQ
ncbi:MAG: hypothetical protein GC168_20485 [Candidatus Hydrogenedens sp.]|nr:hypothetical protein [Candidatus Hydrogenedens sp.]